MEFEILGTRIAMKCHFSCMNSCVDVNLSLKTKTLSTIVTLQWYLFSVYSLYKSFQVTLKIETFHPSVALKWLFSDMNSLKMGLGWAWAEKLRPKPIPKGWVWNLDLAQPKAQHILAGLAQISLGLKNFGPNPSLSTVFDL